MRMFAPSAIACCKTLIVFGDGSFWFVLKSSSLPNPVGSSMRVDDIAYDSGVSGITVHCLSAEDQSLQVHSSTA